MTVERGDFVYVVVGEMLGDELHVFQTPDQAEEFARLCGLDPKLAVYEEPILDQVFVDAAALE